MKSKLLLFAAALTLASAAWGDDDGGIRVSTVSTRPDTVTGGDVLVRVSGGRHVKVQLNGHDVTSAFHSQADGSLLGLVSGLSLGKNSITASSSGRGDGHGGDERGDDRGDDDGGRGSLTVTNYPITGPVFSGPHETPFYCMTTQFKLPASTTTLGAPLDANCSIATRVDYVYKNTAGTFAPLPPGGYPADLAKTTTSTGKTVPYIVRVETGTIDRGIYETAVLHDPTTQAAPTPFNPPAAWNQRLVYTLGGGCVGGWYIQGASLGNGGILEDLMLRQGYAIAASTLNVFGNNCSDLLAAESIMMVKERFIENFGPVALTIGYGCSGGSEAAHPISDDYPGLLDGILVGCSFPEVTAGMIMNITDADLMLHYFTNTKTTWTDAQKLAASGYPTVTTLSTIGPGNAVRTKAQGGSCNALVPANTRYDGKTNPTGVRCDIYDHMVNVYGRDPKTGFARKPLDNVGVQYGLTALNAGKISTQQFLDMNANIGGYDNDGNYVATRTVGDTEAIRRAYETGRVTYGGRGMRHTPIIDYRGYADQPENGNEVHSRFHSFSMRARLDDVNGNHDNQVMLVEDGVSPGSPGLFGDNSPVLSHALTQMDQWVSNVLNDPSHRSIEEKIASDKPADLVDACFTNNGTVKIAEPQVYQYLPANPTKCNTLYPPFSTPRMVAGEKLENNVLKCHLKPISLKDYSVTFSSTELAQLHSIFPDGVCDYNRRGVGQEPLEHTWDFF